MTVESRTEEYTSKFKVPVIDFQPFLDGTPEGKSKVSKEISAAMREVGFLYIINHGIPSLDQKRMFDWSKKFFALSTEAKSKCPHPTIGAHHRGWSSVGKEKVVQMVYENKEIEKLRNVPDVKESFDLGSELNKVYYNIWPDDDDIPAFKEYCQYYYKLSDSVSKNILRAIALGMGLEEEFFIPYHSESDNQLRLLHYPPTPENDLKDGATERIAAHTDFGTLTMLLQDDVGGLQVEEPYKPGSFVNAPCIPDSLVINTGDFLQRWSNDELKSTLHRVKAPPVDSGSGMSKARYSIPFFVSANPKKIVDALPGTYGEGKPKKYEPITSGVYIDMRMNATY